MEKAEAGKRRAGFALFLTFAKKMTMVLGLDELARACGAGIVCKDEADKQSMLSECRISTLLFDSRKLTESSSTAFFAIRTANDDGHNYISSLYENGVRVFLCSCLPSVLHQGAVYLLVEDSVKALQKVGAWVRKSFKGKVIAITGSNGKTIVKEWLRTIVGQEAHVFFSPLSYNSQIGVAVSLFSLERSCDFAVFEAGISKPNEMQALHDMLLPDYGLITNIGDAHGANFSSLEEKLNEKLQLFIGCKKLFCSQSDSFLLERVRAFCREHSVELSSYDVESLAKQLNLPFSDYASRENAAAAAVLARQIGISEEQIKNRAKQLCALDMRLQVKQSVGGSVVLNDSYCLDITSLETALDLLDAQNPKLTRRVILSDLPEKSGQTPMLLSRINSLLLQKNVAMLYGVGADFGKYESLFSIPHSFFASSEDFLGRLHLGEFYHSAILVKGARKAALERISNALDAQNHQSVLEVNLTALDANVRFYRSKLRKGVRLMAMVKASGYGCGGAEVAYELERIKAADYLTVAFADEGVALRQKGVRLPIMVVTPEAEALEKMRSYGLEPMIHNFETLELVENLPLRIHIKLDTGMHRLGFEAADLDRLIERIKQRNNLIVSSVFSHLSCADDEHSDDFTLKQINLFDKMSSRILASFNYPILRHICNSAAIVRFPEAQFDMVRLGIGMYGIGPDEKTNESLRYVQRLQTRLTSIRQIDTGESVSYMRNFVARKPATIGVIPIGYADGLNRHLSERGFKVWIQGKFVPIVGNICMDMCMVDLTGLNAKVGERVVIFGEENPVENMAKALDTISYEIFTSVSPRIKRIYYHE